MDLHCHSEASKDCRTPIHDFPDLLLRRGIAVQAITDHNEIWGAVALRTLVRALSLDDRLTIIVGEEVSTRDGEIIGLFLHDRIPAGMSAEDTVRAIRDQGGLVLLPHGFDPLKRHRLRPEALERVRDEIDIVESFNARVSNVRYNAEAGEWAAKRDLPASAGSDAHTDDQVGECWVQTPDRSVTTPEDLLGALRSGDIIGKWTHPAIAFVAKQLHGFRKNSLRSPSRAS
ncbi:PHP domain-containing protein [Deinococcus yavapaiensis]|nr:PHP domain-containing protein [Deinococcus yavapaiensis]